MASPAPSKKMRHPLGLPQGSVRAALALMVVTVIVIDLARGREIGIFWGETLMIVLAHYFTSRRIIDLPRESLLRLEEEGVLAKESAPLGLPRHTVRFLIIAAFVGSGAYLYQQEGTIPPRAYPVFGVVGAYFIGLLVCGITNRFPGGLRNSWLARRFNDAKALAVLVLMGILAIAILFDHDQKVPEAMRHATIGLVLFYFGSR